MAGGSLADGGCSQELAALVGHGLLDHLIRADKYRLRNCQSKRLGSLHIDDELEPSGLLDREVGGAGGFKILST